MHNLTTPRLFIGWSAMSWRITSDLNRGGFATPSSRVREPRVRSPPPPRAAAAPSVHALMGHVYADGAEIYKACCTILQYAMSQVAVHRDKKGPVQPRRAVEELEDREHLR